VKFWLEEAAKLGLLKLTMPALKTPPESQVALAGTVSQTETVLAARPPLLLKLST
jgi:hypothetical protein